MELLEETFLFEGYVQHFEKLIPKSSAVFPIVLAHNDAQENNILIHQEDNRRLMLIDYEYGGWNPMAMDLANYVNETMLDNAYPGKNGVAWYEENCMTIEELEKMAARYL